MKTIYAVRMRRDGSWAVKREQDKAGRRVVRTIATYAWAADAHRVAEHLNSYVERESD